MPDRQSLFESHRQRRWLTYWSELIELWPGGPSMALGTYFVYFKYLFSLLLIVFAAGSFR